MLGHPAAPVLPKSRFDISETHEDLAFDTPLCRQLKLKVKVYRLSSQKWWLSCIWWKQVMGNVGQDDFNWKNEKWFSLGVRWRKHSWTRDHRSALAFAPKTSAITTRQVSFVVIAITTIIMCYQLDLKIFFPQQFHQIQNQEFSALKSLSRWCECEIALTSLLWNSGGNLCWLRWRLHGYRQLGRKD